MPTKPIIEPPVRASGAIKPASRPRRRNPASKLMQFVIDPDNGAACPLEHGHRSDR